MSTRREQALLEATSRMAEMRGWNNPDYPRPIDRAVLAFLESPTIASAMLVHMAVAALVTGDVNDEIEAHVGLDRFSAAVAAVLADHDVAHGPAIAGVLADTHALDFRRHFE